MTYRLCIVKLCMYAWLMNIKIKFECKMNGFMINVNRELSLLI